MHELTLFDEDDHETSGPSGPLVRVRLTIAYDGTDFRGLAPNTDVRTVVGELVRVLSPLFGFAPDIVMSGRTDAGVHAARQVLSFDAPVTAESGDVDCESIARVINRRLGPEVVALDVAPHAHGIQCAIRRHRTALSISGHQPSSPGSVHCPVRLVGSSAVERRRHAPGVRPLPRATRLLVVLQATQGRPRGRNRCRSCAGSTKRPGPTSAMASWSSRSPVRRSVTRWCAASSGSTCRSVVASEVPASSGACWLRETASRPNQPLRPMASPSSTSVLTNHPEHRQPPRTEATKPQN